MCPSYSSKRGFTLAEVMIAVGLMSLLLFGAITLYLASTQAAMRTSVAGQATRDASNGLQFVMGNAREALSCTLPSDATNFAAPTGSAANYQYQPSSGGTIYTGVKLLFPGTPSNSVRVQDSSGNTFTPAMQPYDKTVSGSILWIYRSDTAGTPNASGGSCLWMRLRRTGFADVSRPVARMILTQGTSAPLAVQFTSPNTGQLQAKIVSGGFSTIGAKYGVVTNEATDGTAITQLSGKCVLMRNQATGY